MKKMIKKLVAATLSATMVLGMSLTALASNPSINVGVVGGSENINVTNIVVPSSYAVALNPEGMEVYPISGTTAVTSQIVSRDFAFLNKTVKDVVVTLELNVTAPKEVKFVENVSGYSADTDYAVHLQAVPAVVSGASVQVVSGTTPTTIAITTSAAELSKAKITAATGSAVTLDAGQNQINFMLDKATGGGKYVLQDDGTIVKTQSVTSNLGTNGIGGFTFQGELNANADWSKVVTAGGIKIVPTYTAEIINEAEGLVGTTNMVTSKFSAGNSNEIVYTVGTKKTDVKTPTAVYAYYQGALVDITKGVSAESGKITITDSTTKADLVKQGSTARVKVVYTTQSGKTKIGTATINVSN